MSQNFQNFTRKFWKNGEMSYLFFQMSYLLLPVNWYDKYLKIDNNTIYNHYFSGNIINHFGGLLKTKVEAVARRCSIKKVLLNILRSSPESTCSRVSFLIKSGTSVFLWILWNFEEHIFYRTPLVAASTNDRIKSCESLKANYDLDDNRKFH